MFEICVLWENKAILGLFMPYSQLEVLASKQLESQQKKVLNISESLRTFDRRF